MQKKILLISQCFYPEIGAQSNRITALTALLSKLGYSVDVLTSEPSSPNKKMYADKRFWEAPGAEINNQNINIIRTKSISRGSKSKPFRRAVYYILFFIKAAVYVRRHRGYDLVIATTPQILAGLAGIHAKRRSKCPLVWDFRDIWPESIAGVDMVKKKRFVINRLARIERRLFKDSALIIYNSKGFEPYLNSKPHTAERVYIPNCLWENEFNAHTFESDDVLRVVYLGNVGLAQDLGKLVKTARETAWNEKITYSVYGDGAFFEKMNQLIEQSGLSNIKCYGMAPKSLVGEILRAHDLAYAHIKDSPVFHTVLPSKLTMYMGNSMPIIAGVAGYAVEMLSEVGCAFVTDPDDHEQAAGILLGLQKSGEMSATLREMGQKGYAYARENFVWERYEEVLEQAIERVLRYA